jgi:signal peptidase II
VSLPGRVGRRRALLTATAILVVDQVTKQWALGRLDRGRMIDLVWTLRLRLTFNEGMAFGAGQGLGVVIGLLAIGIIVVLARQLGRDLDSAHAVALGLIIGGAAGNLIDRLVRDEGLLRGAVVDFIDLQWFPVFNVADAAINIGAVLLILAVLRESRRADGGAAE